MFQKFLNYLSYIVPIVSRRKSAHSKNLNITLVNGKKTLNAWRVNYSHGSLHKIMRFAFEKSGFNRSGDILMLGLGGGSVIDLMRNELHLANHLRVVDIDPEIINIAREEFGIEPSHDLEIICQDAYDFVREDTRKYELIIVDIFINNGVPEKFHDDIFWENISKRVSPTGQIIFNTMLETSQDSLFRNIVENLEKAHFQITVYERVRGTNALIIAKSQK